MGLPAGSRSWPVILKFEFVTTRQTENPDVLLFASVVVAVTTFPAATVPTKGLGFPEVLPLLPKSAGNEPRNTCPSPLPEASQLSLAKNSTNPLVFAGPVAA